MVSNCFELAEAPGPEMRRAVAQAGVFMCLTGNGGLNGFLSACPNLDPREVASSLHGVGAHEAAKQLELVLDRIGVPIPASCAEVRHAILDVHWPDDKDWDLDTLSEIADAELFAVLEKQVLADLDFYLALPQPDWQK